MKQLSNAFIAHAATVLGDTNGGLSGSKIVAFFNAWAADHDVNTPHTQYPFDSPNKRTALLENLRAFPAELQFRMLLDLCDMVQGANRKNAISIKQKLLSDQAPSDRHKITIPLKNPYVLDFLGFGGSAKAIPLQYLAERKALQISLCHANEDKPRARHLYKRLSEDGYSPWLDEENLLPGQDWNTEIPRAVKQADVVLICLSKKSITKQGYVQREIRIALDATEEHPEGHVYIIPARMEDCVVPERLGRWQWVDTFAPNGYSRLCRTLDAKIHKNKPKRRSRTGLST